MEKITGKVVNAKYIGDKKSGNISLEMKGTIHHQGSVFGKDELVIKVEIDGEGCKDLLELYKEPFVKKLGEGTSRYEFITHETFPKGTIVGLHGKKFKLEFQK
jgi:hypothetical protein